MASAGNSLGLHIAIRDDEPEGTEDGEPILDYGGETPFPARIAKYFETSNDHTEGADGGVSIPVAVCFVVNYVMGSGFLGLPWAMNTSGIITSTVLLLVISALLYVTATYILDSMARADAIARYRSATDRPVVDDGDSLALVAHRRALSDSGVPGLGLEATAALAIPAGAPTMPTPAPSVRSGLLRAEPGAADGHHNSPVLGAGSYAATGRTSPISPLAAAAAVPSAPSALSIVVGDAVDPGDGLAPANVSSVDVMDAARRRHAGLDGAGTGGPVDAAAELDDDAASVVLDGRVAQPARRPRHWPRTASEGAPRRAPHLARHWMPGNPAYDAVHSPHFVLTHRKYEIPELVEMFFGQRIRTIYTIGAAAYVFCACISYAAVFGNSMIAEFPIDTFPDETSQYIMWEAIFALLVVPVSLLDLKEQLVVQMAMTGFRVVIMVLMMITATLALTVTPDAFGSTTPDPASVPASTSEYVFFGKDGVSARAFALVLPVIIYSQLFHVGIPVLSEPVRQKKKVHWVFVFAFLTTCTIYLLGSIPITLFFRTTVSNSAQVGWRDYSPKAISFIVVLFPALDMLSVMPINIITLASNIMAAVYGTERVAKIEREQRRTVILWRLGVGLPPIVIACIAHNLTTILDYAGIVGVLICLVMPSALWIVSLRRVKDIWGEGGEAHSWTAEREGRLATLGIRGLEDADLRDERVRAASHGEAAAVLSVERSAATSDAAASPASSPGSGGRADAGAGAGAGAGEDGSASGSSSGGRRLLQSLGRAARRVTGGAATRGPAEQKQSLLAGDAAVAGKAAALAAAPSRNTGGGRWFTPLSELEMRVTHYGGCWARENVARVILGVGSLLSLFVLLGTAGAFGGGEAEL